MPRFHVQVPFLKFHPRPSEHLATDQHPVRRLCHERMVRILKEVSDERMDGRMYRADAADGGYSGCFCLTCSSFKWRVKMLDGALFDRRKSA